MIRNELPYSKEEYYVGAQGNPELNIDITENGDYDVRKYATAKVNVSGGDFSTAKVTTNVTGLQDGDSVVLKPRYTTRNNQVLALLKDGNSYQYVGDPTMDYYSPSGTDEFLILADNGMKISEIYIYTTSGEATITTSGNIIEQDDEYIVTGDCTINVVVAE